MVFKRPGFETLKANTHKLDTKLSTLLGRYSITAEAVLHADTPSSSKKSNQNTLELLIARTNKVVTCDTNRITARDVFNQLSNELREVLKEGDEEQIKRGTLFLLGALLHRYFRLLNEEITHSWGVTLFSVKVYKAKNCRLFLAIRHALNLSPEMPSSYKRDDLNKLDVATVVTALECFRDNMLLDDRYKKYPHFNNDKNFQTYLEAIIDEQKSRDAQSNILWQFRAIHFIQSLLSLLEKEHQKIENALDAWMPCLKKDHPKLGELTLDRLEEHIEKSTIEEPLKEEIVNLLYAPYIKDRFSTLEDHGRLVHEIKTCHNALMNYILFGGYTLIESKNKIESLQFCLHHALGVEKEVNELTNEDRSQGLKFLEQFIENTSDLKLNTEYFGGMSRLKTELLQQQLILSPTMLTPRSSGAESPILSF